MTLYYYTKRLYKYIVNSYYIVRDPIYDIEMGSPVPRVEGVTYDAGMYGR
jgi:hypothetical protein